MTGMKSRLLINNIVSGQNVAVFNNFEDASLYAESHKVENSVIQVGTTLVEIRDCVRESLIMKQGRVSQGKTIIIGRDNSELIKNELQLWLRHYQSRGYAERFSSFLRGDHPYIAFNVSSPFDELRRRMQ